jgi:hypothetical protein
MVYLADMSDGETSDGGVSSSDFIDGHAVQDASNTNTLETMSARCRSYPFSPSDEQFPDNYFVTELRIANLNFFPFI